jgi:hypothetical protein
MRQKRKKKEQRKMGQIKSNYQHNSFTPNDVNNHIKYK